MALLDGRWRLLYSSGFSSGSLGGRRPGPSFGSGPFTLGQVYQDILTGGRMGLGHWQPGCSGHQCACIIIHTAVLWSTDCPRVWAPPLLEPQHPNRGSACGD